MKTDTTVVEAYIREALSVAQSHNESSRAWGIAALEHYETGDNAAAEHAVDVMAYHHGGAMNALRSARRLAREAGLPLPTMPASRADEIDRITSCL